MAEILIMKEIFLIEGDKGLVNKLFFSLSAAKKRLKEAPEVIREKCRIVTYIRGDYK